MIHVFRTYKTDVKEFCWKDCASKVFAIQESETNTTGYIAQIHMLPAWIKIRNPRHSWRRGRNSWPHKHHHFTTDLRLACRMSNSGREVKDMEDTDPCCVPSDVMGRSPEESDTAMLLLLLLTPLLLLLMSWLLTALCCTWMSGRNWNVHNADNVQ